MNLNRRLYDVLADRARQTRIVHLCMGIGYTAVSLDDGGTGVAYTYFDSKSGCTLVKDYQDFEGRPAQDLLALIESRDYLERSMALAVVNALNHRRIMHLPADKGNDALIASLGIVSGSKVAMVGFIKPLVTLLESLGAEVEVIDEFREMGIKEDFYLRLARWADAALITSTAIINNTLEEILEQTDSAVKVALLGPSTPVVAEAFVPWPAIKALAGIVPLDAPAVLKTVRHGLGTPYLHRYCNKVTLEL